MPDRLTTPEGVDKLTDDIAAKLAKLRMSTDKSAPFGNGNGNGRVFQGWAITPDTIWKLGGLVVALGLAAYAFDQKIDAVDKKVATAEGKVTELERQNASYKEDRVKYREGVGSQVQIMKDDISELKGKVSSAEYRIAQLETDRTNTAARMDRTFDIYNKRFDDSRTSAADMAGDIKVLREQTQRILNWAEARGRRPGDAPFGENQMWIQPPYNPRPGLPRALKVIYSP